METKKCPYCQKEILTVAKKCKHCGKLMEEEGNISQQQKSPQEQNEKVSTPMPKTAPVPLTNRQKDSSNQGKNRFLLGTLIGAASAILIVGLYYIVKPKPEQLYLMDTMQPNSNYSYYIAVATNSFEDRIAAGKGGHSGDLQIVSHSFSQQGKLKSIIKSSQLDGVILNSYPSTKYPNVVYFGGDRWDDGGDYDGPTPFYGKVDIETGAYKEFDGEIWGMIARGAYRDCYLALREDLLYIFPQSPIDEAYDPRVTFDPKEYFGDAELWDSAVQKSIIRWVEDH
jgi:hypothetical protein